jgi:Concanavalin A-like lectin/glucanases superfamily
MNREPLMSLQVATRSYRALLGLVALLALAACSGGGAATQVNQVATAPGNAAQNYTGPAPANADVQAFKVSLWQNVTPSDRCGGCHHQGGQSPMFARTDDVNLAYQAAGPLVNLTNASLSELVVKVGGGHNCWVADPSACAATMLVWIQNWIGAGSSSTSQVTLVAPPVQAAGGGKQFPAPVPAGYAPVFQLLTQFCSGCHTPSSASAQQPYFADASNPSGSYIAAQPKINLATPNLSRFYQRLADDLHHCWSTTGPGGAPDCVGSSNAMLAALTAFANGIPVTPIDPTLVVSNAVTLTQGTIAAGGNRYDANVIAKYMFETGQGSTAYDTSGVTPEADLTLYGNITWDSSWGIIIGQGGSAQASTGASQKLASMIQSSGEYSIEAWAAPANVTQTNAWIVSYSGSNTTRDVTLGQAATQYEGLTRSSVTNTAGMPPLVTTTANGAAQAALQHLVLTYDPVNGQKLYVNGIYTGDMDPSKGGTFANWDSTFALVLGNETTGQRQWLGDIKFVAIHNRALTPAQIQQNFAAGVGQRYFLLFGVEALSGVSQSYILFQASQYDNYTYLFDQPKFISLDPNATVPANLPISGIRIGVNGTLAPAAQSFATLNASVGGANYTAANGQLLSKLGTVIPVQLGSANDLFFLSFDQMASHVHAFVDPPGIPVPPVPNNTPQADFGVMNFERFNNALSRITGVPITDAVVRSMYQASQQALPAGTQITAFVSSQQTAMSSLANSYCGELMANQGLRDAFFGNSIESSLGQNANPTLQGAALRQTIETALATNAVGSNVSPASSGAVVNETDALLQRIAGTPVNGLPAISVNATVSQAIVAACTATLSSAAVTVQ